MSSGYSSVELEAIRKARLKAQLAENLQNLRDQMQIKRTNKSETVSGSNIETTVFQFDNEMSGFSKDIVVTGDMLNVANSNSVENRIELDFSALLYETHSKPTRLEIELDTWIKKVDERPIITSRDEADRIRVISELEKTLNTPSMDIEDKIQSVKMRVLSFLEAGTQVSEFEKEKIELDYLEYCALCQMLDVAPSEHIPYRVEKEIVRMTEVLEKRAENEYIMNVITDIMEELGCHPKEEAVLDHTVGQMFSVDNHPLCDVFVANDGRGIMFEPVGDSREGSIEKQRQVEYSANSICSLYAEIEERAAERGVILKRVYAVPVNMGEMCVQSDISEKRARKRRKKAGSQNQKAMGAEG